MVLLVAGPGRCVHMHTDACQCVLRSKPMMMYHHSIDIAAEACVKEEEDDAKVYTHAVYIRLLLLPLLLELRAVLFRTSGSIQ